MRLVPLVEDTEPGVVCIRAAQATFLRVSEDYMNLVADLAANPEQYLSRFQVSRCCGDGQPVIVTQSTTRGRYRHVQSQHLKVVCSTCLVNDKMGLAVAWVRSQGVPICAACVTKTKTLDVENDTILSSLGCRHVCPACRYQPRNGRASLVIGSTRQRRAWLEHLFPDPLHPARVTSRASFCCSCNRALDYLGGDAQETLRRKRAASAALHRDDEAPPTTPSSPSFSSKSCVSASSVSTFPAEYTSDWDSDE